MGTKKDLTEKELILIAERFRILGEVMRLKILLALKGGEKSVSEVARVTGGNQANISNHLKALAHSGILRRRKDGVFVYYAVAEPTVYDLCGSVKKHLLDPPAFETVLVDGGTDKPAGVA